MANPFSRTTRSLDSDGHATALLGLAVVIVLLVVWGLWFFAAGIPIHHTSSSAHLTGAQRVTAVFPLGNSDQIKRGQAARFHPEGTAWEGAAPISATVARVTPDATAGQTYVELVLRLDHRLPAPLHSSLQGRVDIELERVSPATLILRSAGVITPSTNQNQARVAE